MLFRPELIDKILCREKTQTRRLYKPGDILVDVQRGQHLVKYVRDAKGRIRWEVGKTLALQPGRGKPGVGQRIRIVDIGLQEDVRYISDEDAQAEGFEDIWAFLRTWTAINDPVFDYDAEHKWYRWTQRGIAMQGSCWQIYEYLETRPERLYKAWPITFALA